MKTINLDGGDKDGTFYDDEAGEEVKASYLVHVVHAGKALSYIGGDIESLRKLAPQIFNTDEQVDLLAAMGILTEKATAERVRRNHERRNA